MTNPAEQPNWRETELVRLINLLRSQEGDSVTLISDNPDFNGQPNCAVICNGDWTGWEDRRFAADTLLDALSSAVTEYQLPEPRKVIAESNGHHWIERFNLVCCRDRGIVRRADEQNSPCKGVVKVGLRSIPAQPSLHKLPDAPNPATPDVVEQHSSPVTAAQDHEDTSIGGITWHSSDEDSGPDVGLSVYLGPDDRLWAGEISRNLLERQGAPFDSDMGWFLVRYGPGNDTRLIAKFADGEQARDFIEQVAQWVRRPAESSLHKPDALKEALVLLDEYDPRNSDWRFRKIVLREVIQHIALTPAPAADVGPRDGHDWTGEFTEAEFIERAKDHEKAALNGMAAGPNVSYVRTFQACAKALRIAAPLLSTDAAPVATTARGELPTNLILHEQPSDLGSDHRYSIHDNGKAGHVMLLFNTTPKGFTAKEVLQALALLAQRGA